MRTKFNIKNFKVFDKNGVNVDFSPLTFLVGCNSSGKSSIVKALFILKSFFHQGISKERPAIGSKIDFSLKPINMLGSFRNVVKFSSRNKYISLAYDVHSSYINDDVTVTLTLREGDLGNAVVSEVKIAKTDGSVIVAVDDKNIVSGNLIHVVDSFKRYLVAIRFRSQVKDLVWKPGDAWSEKHEKQVNEKIESLFKEATRHCNKDYIDVVYNNYKIKSCKINEQSGRSIEKFIEKGIFTYFPIMDDIQNFTDSESICSFLKSRIKEKDKREDISKAIDLICDDFRKKKERDFLSYYRTMEKSALFSPAAYTDILIKDHLWGYFNDPFNGYRKDCTYNLCANLEKYNKSGNIYYSLVYDTLAHLSEDDIYSTRYEGEFKGLATTFHPFYSSVFHEYVNTFLQDVLSKDITENIDYIGSSRINVRRMYPLEDKNDFSDAVKRYFETRSKYLSLNPPIKIKEEIHDGKDSKIITISEFLPGDFMNKWLRLYRIGDHISLEMDKNGLGLLLKIYLNESDNKGILLADMGYGITQLFSILLQIEEMIMSGLYNRYKDKVSSKGISFGYKYEISPLDSLTVAIEEPEIHLHPKYQSLLAEMIFEAYREYNIQFVIETHSEYLLRKIQTLIGAKKLTPEEVSMIYVEDEYEVKKGASKVRRIPIKEDGCLSEPFGHGFYDEADKLSLELFTNRGK